MLRVACKTAASFQGRHAGHKPKNLNDSIHVHTPLCIWRERERERERAITENHVCTATHFDVCGLHAAGDANTANAAQASGYNIMTRIRVTAAGNGSLSKQGTL